MIHWFLKKQLIAFFFIEDLKRFAYENRLRSLLSYNVEEIDFEQKKDFYILGEFTRYYFAFVYLKPTIVIKDSIGYIAWHLPNNLPEFSYFINKGVIEIKGKKLLHLEGCFETNFSMIIPDSAIFDGCYKTILLIDLNENRLVFHKTFSYYEDDNEENIPLNQENSDEAEYQSNWFNYDIKIENSQIKFYLLEHPTKRCDEQKTVLTGDNFAFYYQYYPEKKKWVKKPSTH